MVRVIHEIFTLTSKRTNKAVFYFDQHFFIQYSLFNIRYFSFSWFVSSLKILNLKFISLAMLKRAVGRFIISHSTYSFFQISNALSPVASTNVKEHHWKSIMALKK